MDNEGPCDCWRIALILPAGESLPHREGRAHLCAAAMLKSCRNWLDTQVYQRPEGWSAMPPTLVAVGRLRILVQNRWPFPALCDTADGCRSAELVAVIRQRVWEKDEDPDADPGAWGKPEELARREEPEQSMIDYWAQALGQHAVFFEVTREEQEAFLRRVLDPVDPVTRPVQEIRLATRLSAQEVRWILALVVRRRRTGVVTTFLFRTEEEALRGTLLAEYQFNGAAGWATPSLFQTAYDVSRRHAEWAAGLPGVGALPTTNIQPVTAGARPRGVSGDMADFLDGKITRSKLFDKETRKREKELNLPPGSLRALPHADRRRVMAEIRRWEDKLGRKLWER